jgi:pentatricopeptide repeat protein
MAEHGLSPDVKTYTLAMDICLRQNLWQVALKIVERMRATKVCLDAVSYSKAILAANIGTPL